MTESPLRKPVSPLKRSIDRSTDQENPWRLLQTIISSAIVVATLLTLWTPSNLFTNKTLDSLYQAAQPVNPADDISPTPLPVSNPRVGLISGHWGHDSGTVCADGLTEEKVNLQIATLVKENLLREGYEVDLMQEFDPKLNGYQSSVLVSIHNDSCEYVDENATGYKVAAAIETVYPEVAARLTACMIQRYQEVTDLQFHPDTITPDMTSYHAFQEIHPNTPAAIIETGFMNLDYEILTKKPDLVAQGVTSGILCFLRNEPINPESTTP